MVRASTPLFSQQLELRQKRRERVVRDLERADDHDPLEVTRTLAEARAALREAASVVDLLDLRRLGEDLAPHDRRERHEERPP